MKRIALSGIRGCGKFLLIDDEDLGLLGRTVYLSTKGYARTYVGANKGAYVHRLIMQPPLYVQIDHRNGDKLDCQRRNLRLASDSQNHYNLPLGKRNSSGYKGVRWHKKAKRWLVQIGANGTRHHVGSFLDLTDAVHAYNAAAHHYHGEFAKLNPL